MTDTSSGNPTLGEGLHPRPANVPPLAPATQRTLPEAHRLEAESLHRTDIEWDPEVLAVASHHGTEPFPLIGDWLVPTMHRLDLDLPIQGAHGDAVSSYQADALANHTHPYMVAYDEKKIENFTTHAVVNKHSRTYTSASTGGAESRPVNSYVSYLIASQNGTTLPPIGTIAAFSGSDPAALANAGWLGCQGALVDQSNYPDLFAVLGTNFGSDGGSRFALPDLRDAFLRGADGGRKLDPDVDTRTAPRPDLARSGATQDNVGSWQTDEFPSHAHSYGEWHDKDHSDGGAGDYFMDYDRSTEQTEETGGSETRPKNSAVNWIIRAT